MKKQQQTADALLGVAQGMKPFRPVAYYDEHMDVIYVELRNCSLLESRVNGWLTILRDNHPEEGQNRCVGFSLKGVKHLFHEIGFAEGGVYRAVDFINKILEKYRDEVPQSKLDEIEGCIDDLRSNELSVNYSPV